MPTGGRCLGTAARTELRLGIVEPLRADCKTGVARRGSGRVGLLQHRAELHREFDERSDMRRPLAFVGIEQRVARDASADDIKKAFRKLARQYHPDTAKNKKTAEAKFKDQFGLTHYVMVEPENPLHCFGEGTTALIIRKDGEIYRVVPDINYLLANTRTI